MDYLSVEQVLEYNIKTATECGCVCHRAHALHCFPCCGATYFRLDKVEEQRVEYTTVIDNARQHLCFCHCGWSTEAPSGPSGDPPQCEHCGCYTVWPGQPISPDAEKDCILVRRERYPYLQTVVDYISTLPHQKESYVSLKVGQHFNLTKEEVHDVRVAIALMKWDMEEHPLAV